MSPQERQSIKILWVKLSAYYQFPIRDEVFEMYLEDIEDLSYDQVVWAMGEYRKDPKNIRVPLPAQIRAKIIPPANDEDDAKEVAALIVSAVTKLGHTAGSSVRDYVGEVGWEVIRRQGGWFAICETMTSHNKTQMQAQFRDLALSVIHRSKRGTLEQAPQLARPAWETLAPGDQVALSATMFLNKPTKEEERRSLFDEQIRQLAETKRIV